MLRVVARSAPCRVDVRRAAIVWKWEPQRPPIFMHTTSHMQTRCLWMGSSSSLHTMKPSPLSCCSSPIHQIQCRNYIFLPASLSDASKLLKTLFDSNQTSHKRLVVKLKNRWDDTVFSFRERIQLLKTIQREQRKKARQRAHAARNTMINNMQGNVGKFSSKLGLWGRRNALLSHYNAKKRVYARRKVSRQLARKMKGSYSFMDVWKAKYALRKNRWGWISEGSGGIATTIIDDKSSSNAITWKGVTLTEPAQRSWFDEEGFPITSRDPETGRFVNPWLSESSNGENGLKKFLRWKLGGAWCRFLAAIGISSDSDICEEARGGLKGKKSDIGAPLEEGINKDAALAANSSQKSRPLGVALGDRFYHTSTIDHKCSQDNAISLTWIGHASTVVNLPGNFTILTDPHFSNYAGPVRRSTPPAFGAADLPEVVDCVLISHDHMDHCKCLHLWKASFFSFY